MTELQEIKSLLERINKKLTLQQSQPETWVKGRWVMEMTIFNTGNRMRKAREQGLLKFKGVGNMIRYSINHIDEKFFVKDAPVDNRIVGENV